jgi:peptidoglycan/LPS O-acetylase OafA/YrhL
MNERNPLLDAMRFIAAVGVIVWHVAPLSAATARWGVAGHFAVAFFTCTAVGLTVNSFGRNPQRPLWRYVWTRVLRIYLPFLCWTLVYLLLRDAKYRMCGQAMVPLNGALLVAGTAHHLWFLPFVLVATATAAALAKGVLFQLPAWVVVVIAVTGALCWARLMPVPVVAAGDDGSDGLTLGYWWVQVSAAMPSAWMGLAVGRIWTELAMDPWRSRVAWLGLMVVVAGALGGAGLTLANLSNSAWVYGGGFGMVLLSFGAWNSGGLRIMAGWGRVAYGIYLVHVGWYLLLEILLRRWVGGADTAMMMANLLLAVALSTGSALWLARNRFTAWSIGMGPPLPLYRTRKNRQNIFRNSS